MSITPNDHSARQRALETQTSFAVSAPAGSGKTGLLTQRVLALLATCDQPENILAITFTKKAANEMQERIFAALKDASINNEPPLNPFTKTTWSLAKKVIERDRQQGWQLMECPNRCRITTIDSFCRLLSQQSPLNHQLGDAPEILEQPDVAYLQAARQTLALIESTEPIQQDIVRLVKHFNNQLSTLETFLVRLLSKRDQWLSALFSARDKRHDLEVVLQHIISEHFAKARRQLSTYASDIILFADYAANQLSKDPENHSSIQHCLGLKELPEADASQRDCWLGISELLLTNEGSVRKKVDKRQGFITTDKQASKEENTYAKNQKKAFIQLLITLSEEHDLIDTLNDIRSLPSPEYSDSQWQLLDSLTRILHRLVAELFLTFKDTGKTDYVEITLAALDALGDIDNPTDLSLLLEYRLQHILIDEFQDTSSTQFALLERLTAGWQQNDGHTLFVVGDAMQSCYRFRNANVGLFLELRENGIGNINLHNLNLEVNFRSHQNVVHWVNRIFDSVFPYANSINDGAVNYSQAIAYPVENKKHQTSDIRCQLLINDNHRQAEAQVIIKHIQHCRLQNSRQSIAILVRSRQQVPVISQALLEHDIKFRATDIDSLARRMIIQDLLSLTKALLFPHDRIAWLSLLRTPWCGLDMHDLYAVANPPSQDPTTPDILTTILHNKALHLSEAGQQLFANFSHIIHQALNKQQRCSLRGWVESTWRALGGDQLVLDENDIDNAERFFECLATFDDGGRISHWPSFLSAIEALYSKPQIHSAQDEPCVEIMTIHKSKGLEFDTVIIPGIDKNQRNDTTELLEWMEHITAKGNCKLLISPVNATGDEADSIYQYIRQQNRKKQNLESDRVFYVGCTRAINNLFLLGCADSMNLAEYDQEQLTIDNIKPPNGNSPLASLWPHIKDEIELIDSQAYSIPTSKDSIHPNVIYRRPVGWQPEKIKPNNILAAYRPHPHQESNANQDNRASREPLMQRYVRYFGTVLHEAMQQITQQGYQTITLPVLETYAKLWLNRLTSLGTPKTMANEQTAKIKQALQTMLANRERLWFLDQNHHESECELILHYRSDNEFKHSIIDRTFICEEMGRKTRWIIDYKSSEPDPSQTLEEFIEHELKQYQAQMQHYAKLFKHETQPIKTALYFPLIDYFAEL